jgi:hypothetical protein
MVENRAILLRQLFLAKVVDPGKTMHYTGLYFVMFLKLK